MLLIRLDTKITDSINKANTTWGGNSNFVYQLLQAIDQSPCETDIHDFH